MYQHQINIDTLGVFDLEWGDKWSYLRLAVNGQTLGNFKSKKELSDGQRVALPDGREIYVHYDGKELNIWLDGKVVLSGRATGASYNNAVSAIFFFGILGIIVGYFRFIRVIDTERNDVLSIILNGSTLAFGCILTALGFWAKFTRSKTPLYIAFTIGCISIIQHLMHGISFAVAFQGFFIYLLLNAILAAPSKEMRREKIDMHGPLDANN